MTYEKDIKVCISVKTLYEKSKNLKYTTIVPDYDENGIMNYYDLYNESGQLACMDGETCTVVRVEFGNVVLKNEDGNTPVCFKLSLEEADASLFVLE